MTIMQRARTVGLSVVVVAALFELLAGEITVANVVGFAGSVTAAALLAFSRPFVAVFVAAASLSIAALDRRASIVGLIVMVACVCVVGARCRPRSTAIAGVVGLVACAITIRLDDNVSMADGLQPMSLVVVVAVAGWVVAREMRTRSELERLRVANDLALARSELARDVHDVTSHALMAVLAQLRVGRRGLANDDPAATERGLGHAEAAVKDAIADLRSLTQIVAGSPAQLASCSTLSQVYAQIDQAAATFPTAVVHHDDADGEIDARVATTAIRVVQQCLANAAAHAPGNAVAITTKRVENLLVVAAANAVGEPSEPGLRMGLAIMAQRVRDVGGSFASGIADGAFRVRCELPIGPSR
jgi:signal transduction histidine kinase